MVALAASRLPYCAAAVLVRRHHRDCRETDSASRVADEQDALMKFDRQSLLLLIGSGVCILTALILGMASISVTYHAAAGEEQPKVTDWMQAWGSVLGVLTGLTAALAATWLLRHERQQAREARTELAAERAEAALALARTVIVSAARFTIVNGLVSNVIATVHNDSAGPIRQVQLHVDLPGQRLPLPPISAIPRGVVQESRRKFSPPVELGGDGWSPVGGRAPVTAVFVDFTGQRWCKTDEGEPEKWRDASNSS